MVIEMLLYHALDETGLLQVSATSATGPWTDLRLPSTMTVRDALSTWQQLAHAAIPSVGWDFQYDEGNGVVNLYTDFGTGWIKCTETLQVLLGQPEIGQAVDGYPGAGITSTVNGVRVSRTTAFAEESGDFEEFSGGRVGTYHYGFAKDVGVTLYLPDQEFWWSFYDYPLFQGLCAFSLELDNNEEFSEGVEGGRMVLYPYQTTGIERLEGSEDFVKVGLKCTLGEALP